MWGQNSKKNRSPQLTGSTPPPKADGDSLTKGPTSPQDSTLHIHPLIFTESYLQTNKQTCVNIVSLARGNNNNINEYK